MRMLELTTTAADHLRQVRREKSLEAEAIPRFARRSGRLVLSFAKRPAAGDRVLDSGGISALIARSAGDLLDAKLIDVKQTDGRAYLVVRRTKDREGRPARSATSPSPSA